MNPHDLALMRYTLALIWLVTGVLTLFVYPISESLKLLAQVGLQGAWGEWALYGSSALDLSLGVLTLCWPRRCLWQMQAALIVFYSVVIAWCLPEFWLHPFAPILKNVPILLLLWWLYRYQEVKHG